MNDYTIQRGIDGWQVLICGVLLTDKLPTRQDAENFIRYDLEGYLGPIDREAEDYAYNF